MQVVLAAIYIAVLYFIGELDTAIKIPFTSIEWIMPIWLYIPFVMFVVVGVVNAVNLTDGLDGFGIKYNDNSWNILYACVIYRI